MAPRDPSAVEERNASTAAVRPFRVDVVPERESVRVVPAGELDLATVDQVADRLQDMREAAFGRIVLDLRALTFIDTSGLHLAHCWDAEARSNGMEFALIAGPAEVQRLFEMTGLSERLDFVGK